MTRRGRPPKKPRALAKDSPPSTSPSSLSPTSSTLSWYGKITAMHLAHSASNAAPQAPSQSPVSSVSFSYRPYNLRTTIASGVSTSSSRTSSSSTGRPREQSPPMLPTSPASQRHQAIPISFLVHPTHVSPQPPSSLLFSPSATTLTHQPPSSPTTAERSRPINTSLHRRLSPTTPAQSFYDPDHYYDRHQPVGSSGLIKTDLSPGVSSSSSLSASWQSQQLQSSPSPRHRTVTDFTAVGNQPRGHFSSRSSRFQPQSRRDIREEEEELEKKDNNNNSNDVQLAADTASQSGGESSTRTVSDRRRGNRNVKTTKTGKILHKSKKVGLSRRLTAYDRFLQQRSRTLALERPELTPQQRMKVIAEEWVVSDKNQHKTRRKSRFLGPNGELLLSSSTLNLAISSGNNTFSPTTLSMTAIASDMASIPSLVGGKDQHYCSPRGQHDLAELESRNATQECSASPVVKEEWDEREDNISFERPEH